MVCNLPWLGTCLYVTTVMEPRLNEAKVRREGPSVSQGPCFEILIFESPSEVRLGTIPSYGLQPFPPPLADRFFIGRDHWNHGDTMEWTESSGSPTLESGDTWSSPETCYLEFTSCFVVMMLKMFSSPLQPRYLNLIKFLDDLRRQPFLALTAQPRYCPRYSFREHTTTCRPDSWFCWVAFVHKIRTDSAHLAELFDKMGWDWANGRRPQRFWPKRDAWSIGHELDKNWTHALMPNDYNRL